MVENNRALELLYKIGKDVMAEVELPKLLDQIMATALKALKASAASIMLIDEKTGELFFEAATGTVGDALLRMRLKVQSGIAFNVVRNGQPVISNDVFNDQRFNKAVDLMTGFNTKSILCVPLMVGGETIGALEVLNKCGGSRFDNRDVELLTALASTSTLAINNGRLHKTLLNSYIDTIKMLSETIDARDPYTHGHSYRVTQYALMAGSSLSLSPDEMRTIEYGGILHDIGKIAIDDAILRNTSQHLTPEEWTVIRSHPTIGANIISDVNFLKDAKMLVLHHHERYDGTGYPDGLKGERIPFGARILAVADAFDAMTTDRPYRTALSPSLALQEVERNRNTQFCPLAADAFITSMQAKNRKSKGMPILDNSGLIPISSVSLLIPMKKPAKEMANVN
jgi:HD-GYP domain-containing protein (c-di-GMP phosphodiesterase class II)